jgi:hypothetical protein
MKSKKQQLNLMFVADRVVTIGYVGPKEDKAIDKLLEDITVSKEKIPCG